MKTTTFLTFILTFSTMVLFAQKKEEAALAESVKRLNQAMIDANQIALEELTAKNLSYGHSSGLIEDKDKYITAIVDGTFGFTSIDLTDQTIAVSGDVAIVRHKFQAATDDKGKEPGSVKLSVMQVWQKQKGKWLLLARQATRIQ
ncbi:MAG TPA: nuclear transport factor 2 family protein [Chryseosolibacter sp.]|nr:nuclear transport factor 2 family protein [Chryseosolibacter sp.]